MERQLAVATADDPATRHRRKLEEDLLAAAATASSSSTAAAEGPLADCPHQLRRSIEGLHSSNIVCIACWPAAGLAATGSSNGTVALLRYGGGSDDKESGVAAGSDAPLVRATSVATCGVLCLAPLLRDGDCANASTSGSCIVAAGCMDGSVAVLDAVGGVLLARATPHRKYVVAASWAPGGRHLVTASWDQSYAVLRLQRRSGGAGDGSGEGGDAAGWWVGEWELVVVHQEQCAAKVNAVEFLPPPPLRLLPSDSKAGGGGGSSSSSFLVAVQGSNYLRQLSISERGGSGGGDSGTAATAATDTVVRVREERRINLNALGDDHVSFSAAALALSLCRRMLLVSADNGRLLVYETEGEWSEGWRGSWTGGGGVAVDGEQL